MDLEATINRNPIDEMTFKFRDFINAHVDENMNLNMEDIQTMAIGVYLHTNADLHAIYKVPEYVRQSTSSQATAFQEKIRNAIPSVVSETGLFHAAIATYKNNPAQFMVECDKLRKNLVTFQQTLEQTHHKLQALFEAHDIYLRIIICSRFDYRIKNLDRLIDDYAQQFERQSKLFEHMQSVSNLEPKDAGIGHIRKLFRAHNQPFAEFLSAAKQTAKSKIEKECNGADRKCSYEYLVTFVTELNKYGERAFELIHAGK